MLPLLLVLIGEWDNHPKADYVTINHACQVTK